MLRISRIIAPMARLNSLKITDAAATRLAEICSKEEYLRVSVGGGGCSGYSYEFDLSDDKIDPEEDLIFTHLKQRVGRFNFI